MEKLHGRVWAIDEARGLAILLMVVYHTFYDVVVIFGMNIPVFYSPFIQSLVILFAGLFIFISGTACHYSRNNLKRGGICFLLGLALTTGTALVMPDEFIAFGILHMLGICMMLFPLLQKWISKISPSVGLPVALLLWALFFHLPDGYLGFEGLLRISMPRQPYEWRFLFWLGFPPPGFFSSDYFPILPWIFCFLAGGFFGVLVKENRLPSWFYHPHIRPLAFVGRHTLIVYLLHQPIVYGLLTVIFSIIPQ